MVSWRVPRMSLDVSPTVCRLLASFLVLFMGYRAAAQSADKTWFPTILTEEGAREHYLPDWSYAGYHWGEKALPDLRPTLDVTKYGAIPDDGKDDTRAILHTVNIAHQLTDPVVLFFPRGRFILREVVWIQRGHFVLRGAGSGPDGTVLEMPNHLGEMDLGRAAELFGLQKDFNDRTGRQDFSPFSWTGGVIWARKPGKLVNLYTDYKPSEALARGMAGRRGDHQITVDSAARLKVGGVYWLLRYNHGEDDSLLRHVYEWNGDNYGSWVQKVPVHSYLTVTQISGNVVTVKEPLLHDVRPEWDSALFDAEVLEEVGIEHLRIEFPNRKVYGGHHKEAGYNAIALNNVRHGWVRDVAVDNADTAIKCGLCCNVTLDGIEVTERIGCHYALHFAMNCRCLARHFRIDTKAIHTLSFNTGERGSVFTGGTTTTAHLDQHCGMNHQNLFDNIRVLEAEPGFSLFLHGGGSEFFPLHGAFNTFWNIDLQFPNPRSEGPAVVIEGSGLPAPNARLVGIRGNVPIDIKRYAPDAYIEGTSHGGIAVPSLYEYQLKKRLADRQP